jgi:hypothetical protein
MQYRLTDSLLNLYCNLYQSAAADTALARRLWRIDRGHSRVPAMEVDIHHPWLGKPDMAFSRYFGDTDDRIQLLGMHILHCDAELKTDPDLSKAHLR